MNRHAISLKVREDLYEEAEILRLSFHKPRNAYINDAIAFYNHIMRKEMLKVQLQKESKLVKKHSIKILQELDALDDRF